MSVDVNSQENNSRDYDENIVIKKIEKKIKKRPKCFITTTKKLEKKN